MAIDWATHYAVIYNNLGQAATLTPSDASTDDVPLTAIDHTKGEAVGDSVEIATVLPVAYVRMTELADNGLAREQVKGGTLTLNGRNWRVKATIPQPSGAGEDEGELKLILADESPTS